MTNCRLLAHIYYLPHNRLCCYRIWCCHFSPSSDKIDLPRCQLSILLSYMTFHMLDLNWDILYIVMLLLHLEPALYKYVIYPCTQITHIYTNCEYLKVSIRAKTLMQKLNNGSNLFIFIKSCYKTTKLSVIRINESLIFL